MNLTIETAKSIKQLHRYLILTCGIVSIFSVTQMRSLHLEYRALEDMREAIDLFADLENKRQKAFNDHFKTDFHKQLNQDYMNSIKDANLVVRLGEKQTSFERINEAFHQAVRNEPLAYFPIFSTNDKNRIFSEIRNNWNERQGLIKKIIIDSAQLNYDVEKRSRNETDTQNFISIVLSSSDGKITPITLRISILDNVSFSPIRIPDVADEIRESDLYIKNSADDLKFFRFLDHFSVPDPMLKKTPSELIEWFKRENISSKNQMQISGVRIAYMDALYLGPIVILFILVYIGVYLRKFISLTENTEVIYNFPWIGFFQDIISRVVTFITLLLLPVLANSLVFFLLITEYNLPGFCIIVPIFLTSMFSYWMILPIYPEMSLKLRKSA